MVQDTFKTDQRNRILIVVVFIISPFLSLVVAIRNCFSSYFKNIIWMFCGFYGFTFYPVRTTMDAYGHMANFVELANQPNLTIKGFMVQLYSTETNFADVFLPMVEYFVSRFMGSTSFFYGMLGLLFGYFFSRNIAFLLSYSKQNLNKYLILIIVAFALLIGPWEINSFRFWMAAHVLAFSLFRVLIQKKNNYLLGIVLTPLIHFGFLFVVVLFFVYKIFGNRIWGYYIILFASLFFNGVTSSQIGNIIPTTNIEVFDDRITGYSSEGYIEERAEGASKNNWYVSARITLLYYFTIFLAFLVFYRNKIAILNSKFLSLLSFTILMMAVSFALMNIVPTFFRYLRVSVLLFYAFLFLFMIDHYKWYRKLYPIHVFTVLFFTIIEIRIFFDSATIDTFFSNLIIASYYQTYEPFISFIK